MILNTNTLIYKMVFINNDAWSYHYTILIITSLTLKKKNPKHLTVFNILFIFKCQLLLENNVMHPK